MKDLDSRHRGGGPASAIVDLRLRAGVARNLRLFNRSPRREFVWRIWRDFRQAGRPIPEAVAVILDAWAAEPPTEHELTLIRAAERSVDVVDMHARLRGEGLGSVEADEAIAEHLGLSPGNVRVIRSRWKSGEAWSEQAHEADEGRALQSLWASLVTPEGHST
ncbi:MAG: hypothetical protein ACTHL8_01045 [Burkholderiaceae bacterium]